MTAGRAQSWAEARLPRLDGRCALVTGAASGLGLATALGLAQCGAQVLIADRNVAGGEAAVQRVRDAGGSAEFLELDLGDLAAIRAFAQALNARGQPIDILVNNAGILPPLQRRTTRDGFELKFGINVLGHYALDGLLLPSLRRSAAARIVWVSSLVHRSARLDFGDLNAERRYFHQRAYGQAKLACLVLAMEMHERCRVSAPQIASLAVHPGIARTAIGESRHGQVRTSVLDHLADFGFWIAMRFMSQPQEQGALPILLAAAGSDARSGEFYGPKGFGEMSGLPVRVQPSAPACDPATRERLWQACERLTGVRYDFNP